MEEGPAMALEARRGAIMASGQPEISKGCLLRNGYSAVLTGVTNSILADVLNGRLNATPAERAMESLLDATAFLGAGGLPVIFSVLPKIGGAVAVLPAVAAAVGIIAVLPSVAAAVGIIATTATAQGSSSGVTALVCCGVVLAAQFTLATRMTA